MKNIQVFKPYYRVDECLEEIKECLDIGWTGMGFKTQTIEEQWKAFTDLPNAHFLSSATVGLHLAVKILKEHYGWDSGAEVITTPFTFVSTNHAIKYENLQPVFADIDDSLNLSPAAVEAKITERTKAIIFVGIGGNAKNLPEIIAIARRHGLKVILDAAHMAGTRIDGRHVGFDVDVTVFSFQAVKNLPTADSGMICFNDESLDKRCRVLSWLGIDKDTFSRSNAGTYKWAYNVADVGYKYHGNSIMAALAIVGLKYLDADNNRRREMVELYKKHLAPGIAYVEHEACMSSRHTFQLVLENRDEVIAALAEAAVYPGVHYLDNTFYPPYEGEANVCERSRYYTERVLSLPLHLHLEEDDIERIATVVNQSARN